MTQMSVSCRSGLRAKTHICTCHHANVGGVIVDAQMASKASFEGCICPLHMQPLSASHLSGPGLLVRAAHLNNVFSSFMSWVNLSQGVWRLHHLLLNCANSLLGEKSCTAEASLLYGKQRKQICT